MGKYTRAEFCNGMTTLGYETVDDLKKNLKKLREKLDNEKELKEIYRFTFNFAKEPTARNMGFESALALWDVLLKGKFVYLKQWLEFMNSKEKKNDIPKDLWNMLLEFHFLTRGDLTKYVDDGAWPVLIDEFVDYLKKK